MKRQKTGVRFNKQKDGTYQVVGFDKLTGQWIAVGTLERQEGHDAFAFLPNPVGAFGIHFLEVVVKKLGKINPS